MPEVRRYHSSIQLAPDFPSHYSSFLPPHITHSKRSLPHRRYGNSTLATSSLTVYIICPLLHTLINYGTLANTVHLPLGNTAYWLFGPEHGPKVLPSETLNTLIKYPLRWYLYTASPPLHCYGSTLHHSWLKMGLGSLSTV